ncbi:DUF4233 domain-containing protein [Demequina sp.]|uniref:DUF4233 domain-containing protein n=1 Tax=Demequina sp. TaxID=2050685 RepID=UPI003A8BB8E4
MTDIAQPTPASAPRKPQRPATLVFTQAVLLCQAFVALFATLVTWSFARNDIIDAPPGVMLGGGLALMVALGYASGQQPKRWGRILGWILQLPLLLGGLLVPMIAVLGAVFLVLWIMALRLGGKIDRERKEREQAVAS